MEAKPSRAKRRISSRPSHGFLVRLRRSTRCAVVSLAVVVGAVVVIEKLGENKKPTARLLWRWVDECRYYEILRSAASPRQCARMHNNNMGSSTSRGNCGSLTFQLSF